MTESRTSRHRPGSGPMGRRLFVALGGVSLAALAVHTVGTVVPHLLADPGHGQAVETGWLVAATAVAVAVALAVSYAVSVRLVAPLEDFVGMARAFAAGDHGARVPDSGRPEIADLTHALNAAAAEVERSEQARDRFTDEVAHELRTPLTALRAGLEELRDGLVPADHATLAALHDQATRLGRIVEDLSQLSAAESPGLLLSIEDVELDRLAGLSLAARDGALTSAGLLVEADLEPGVTVAADPDRIHQVLGNLLANAAQYCRPGDRVLVRVRSAPPEGVVEVVDSGPGLDEVERRHAFERAWRGRSARGTAGSGLGLAIVRALVAAHGGRVSLSTPADGGLHVEVRLPLADAVGCPDTRPRTGSRAVRHPSGPVPTLRT
jgi:two-component system sensor histidine kinase BaeS